jgi:hypothetical protein
MLFKDRLTLFRFPEISQLLKWHYLGDFKMFADFSISRFSNGIKWQTTRFNEAVDEIILRSKS